MTEQLSERIRVEIGYRTDTGMQRDHNEDSLSIADVSPALLHERGYLFVVADGVGGKAAGDTASTLAAETMQTVYYTGDFVDAATNLSQAIHSANAAILSQGENPSYAGLASTVAAVVVHGYESVIGHVGDSRVYLINSDVRRLTEDHTWVAEQMREGLLTADEASHHGCRHVLVQSLGKSDITPTVRGFIIPPRSSLLLCSDGLHALVTDAELMELVRQNPPQVAADQLIGLANQRGGNDNITVIIVRVHEGVDSQGRDGSNTVIASAISQWESLPMQKQTLAIILVSLLGCFILAGVAKLFMPGDVRPAPVQSPTATQVVLQATTTPERKPTSTLAVTPTTKAAPASPSDTLQIGVIGPHPTAGGDGVFLMPTPKSDNQAGIVLLQNGSSVVILEKNITGEEIYGDVIWHRVRVEVQDKVFEGYVPASIVEIEER